MRRRAVKTSSFLLYTIILEEKENRRRTEKWQSLKLPYYKLTKSSSKCNFNWYSIIILPVRCYKLNNVFNKINKYIGFFNIFFDIKKFLIINWNVYMRI